MKNRAVKIIVPTKRKSRPPVIQMIIESLWIMGKNARVNAIKDFIYSNWSIPANDVKFQASYLEALQVGRNEGHFLLEGGLYRLSEKELLLRTESNSSSTSSLVRDDELLSLQDQPYFPAGFIPFELLNGESSMKLLSVWNFIESFSKIIDFPAEISQISLDEVYESIVFSGITTSPINDPCFRSRRLLHPVLNLLMFSFTCVLCGINPCTRKCLMISQPAPKPKKPVVDATPVADKANEGRMVVDEVVVEAQPVLVTVPWKMPNNLVSIGQLINDVTWSYCLSLIFEFLSNVKHSSKDNVIHVENSGPWKLANKQANFEYLSPHDRISVLCYICDEISLMYEFGLIVNQLNVQNNHHHRQHAAYLGEDRHRRRYYNYSDWRGVRIICIFSSGYSHLASIMNDSSSSSSLVGDHHLVAQSYITIEQLSSLTSCLDQRNSRECVLCRNISALLKTDATGRNTMSQLSMNSVLNDDDFMVNCLDRGVHETGDYESRSNLADVTVELSSSWSLDRFRSLPQLWDEMRLNNHNSAPYSPSSYLSLVHDHLLDRKLNHFSLPSSSSLTQANLVSNPVELCILLSIDHDKLRMMPVGKSINHNNHAVVSLNEGCCNLPASFSTMKHCLAQSNRHAINLLSRAVKPDGKLLTDGHNDVDDDVKDRAVVVVDLPGFAKAKTYCDFCRRVFICPLQVMKAELNSIACRLCRLYQCKSISQLPCYEEYTQSKSTSATCVCHLMLLVERILFHVLDRCSESIVVPSSLSCSQCKPSSSSSSRYDPLVIYTGATSTNSILRQKWIDVIHSCCNCESCRNSENDNSVKLDPLAVIDLCMSSIRLSVSSDLCHYEKLSADYLTWLSMPKSPDDHHAYGPFWVPSSPTDLISWIKFGDDEWWPACQYVCDVGGGLDDYSIYCKVGDIGRYLMLKKKNGKCIKPSSSVAKDDPDVTETDDNDDDDEMTVVAKRKIVDDDGKKPKKKRKNDDDDHDVVIAAGDYCQLCEIFPFDCKKEDYSIRKKSSTLLSFYPVSYPRDTSKSAIESIPLVNCLNQVTSIEQAMKSAISISQRRLVRHDEMSIDPDYECCDHVKILFVDDFGISFFKTCSLVFEEPCLDHDNEEEKDDDDDLIVFSDVYLSKLAQEENLKQVRVIQQAKLCYRDLLELELRDGNLAVINAMSSVKSVPVVKPRKAKKTFTSSMVTRIPIDEPELKIDQTVLTKESRHARKKIINDNDYQRDDDMMRPPVVAKQAKVRSVRKAVHVDDILRDNHVPPPPVQTIQQFVMPPHSLSMASAMSILPTSQPSIMHPFLMMSYPPPFSYLSIPVMPVLNPSQHEDQPSSSEI